VKAFIVNHVDLPLFLPSLYCCFVAFHRQM